MISQVLIPNKFQHYYWMFHMYVNFVRFILGVQKLPKKGTKKGTKKVPQKRPKKVPQKCPFWCHNKDTLSALRNRKSWWTYWAAAFFDTFLGRFFGPFLDIFWALFWRQKRPKNVPFLPTKCGQDFVGRRRTDQKQSMIM